MFTNSSIRGMFGDALVSDVQCMQYRNIVATNGTCILQNELDWEVGQIFNAINEAGIADNTFVFFTADNG